MHRPFPAPRGLPVLGSLHRVAATHWVRSLSELLEETGAPTARVPMPMPCAELLLTRDDQLRLFTVDPSTAGEDGVCVRVERRAQPCGGAMQS